MAALTPPQRRRSASPPAAAAHCAGPAERTPPRRGAPPIPRSWSSDRPSAQATRKHALARPCWLVESNVPGSLRPLAAQVPGEDLHGSAQKKLQQFRRLCDLYKGKVPADLTDLIGRRQRRSDMYLNQPWLFYVSAVLKYGPARHQLEVEADKLGLARPTSVSASTVRTLLVRTSQALQGTDMAPWVLNCGRVRQSGYLAWFLKRGVVQQPSSDLRGSAELCLGQGRKMYTVADKCTPELRLLCNSMLSLSVTIRTCQRRPSAPWPCTLVFLLPLVGGAGLAGSHANEHANWAHVQATHLLRLD